SRYYYWASQQIAAISDQIERLKAEERNAKTRARSSKLINENIPAQKDTETEFQKFASIGNFIGAEVYRGGIGPEYEFAERALTERGKLETFALRTRSIAMRDVFARTATNLHYNALDMKRLLVVVSIVQSGNASLIKTRIPELLVVLARVLANQRM